MESLIVISPYPQKGSIYGNSYSALASFTANTLKSLCKLNPDLDITVLAEKFQGAFSYKEKQIEVKRVWSRGSLFVYWSLILEIIRIKSASKVLIELEWSLFGRSPFIIFFMPVFIALLRILGKEVYTVLHEVLFDFHQLAPQVGIKEQSCKAKVFDTALKLYYRGLILFSTKIIVLEKYFADQINQYFHTSKAVFIPHGVDTRLQLIKTSEAKQILKMDPDTFVILKFGFINWYKGTDLAIELFLNFTKRERSKNFRLIITGGESQIHRTDKNYQDLSKKIKDSVYKSENIELTGFIPDEKIALYFNAADFVIFPYRVLISSSGPLSLAYTFEKPLLLSEKLKNYLISPDMQEALKRAELNEDDLFFDLNDDSFMEGLTRSIRISEKLEAFSKFMKKFRDWDQIAIQYSKELKF